MVFSTLSVDLNTKYTTMILSTKAIMMLMESNSARNESMVVKDPAPAIRGKAIGTMLAPAGESCLNMLMPKIISNAITTSTKEPAIANDEMSTPNNPNNGSPKKKNSKRMPSEIKEACIGFIVFPFFLIFIITGIDPRISITAKRTINAERICRNCTCIAKFVKGLILTAKI